MRVLMLRDSFPNGGAERQLALLAESLPGSVDVRVWGMGGGPFVAVLRELGLPVELSERRWRLDPSPVAGLWRLVRAWRPDVLHTWQWMSAAAALPVAAALPRPRGRRHHPQRDGRIRGSRCHVARRCARRVSSWRTASRGCGPGGSKASVAAWSTTAST